MSKLDTVKSWVDAHRVNGLVKPFFLARVATDNNWIFDTVADGNFAPIFNVYGHPTRASVMMNSVSPGMRVPSVLTWNVTESTDNITNTATLECLNSLPISRTTTTLTSNIPQRLFTPTISYNIVRNGNGVLQLLTGDRAIAGNWDPSRGASFRESDLVNRVVAGETFSVSSPAGFPDPRVPWEEWIDETGGNASGGQYWTGSTTGIGAYFVLIGNEVIRITNWDGGNTFTIPPGGRAANGVLENHNAGATITLLGFSPWTGKWTAPGYLTPDDYRPYQNLLKPGTCIATYEGYGNPTGQLSKNPSIQDSYSFTGYWFVKRPNSQLGDDGESKIQFDLLSSGYVLTHQKITRDEIYSSGNTINAWKTSVFDSGGSTRAMLGDSIDYNSWDPTLPNAYPLKIYTELGQHKAFFEHMNETQMGLQCEFCQKEYNDYVAREGKAGKNPLGEAKSVGKHIYKESIRVYNIGSPMSGVPLRTWLYIPIKMALGAWDHPLDSSQIAQRWTKLPQQLYKNLTDWYTQTNNQLFIFTLASGRIWNSQLSFSVPGQDVVTYDTMTQDDRRIVGNRVQLTCPFQAEYDNQEWSAPIQDFADVNNMTFYISREGYPCFVPRGFRLRGFHTGSGEGDWHMALGQSISSYSHDIDPDSLFTTAWITAQTAFNVEVSISSGGTSWDVDNQQWLWNSGKVGNKEGLHLTAGVAQVDTVSLDHLLLGFDWNTNPASTGIVVQRDNQLYTIYKQPTLPIPRLSLGQTNHPTRVRMLRQVINFMVDRKYILIPARLDDGDGAYDSKVAQGVAAVQRFINQQQLNAYGYRGQFPIQNINGTWDGYTYGALSFYFKNAGEFMKLDPWWWVINGFDWDAYVSHICGIIIPERKARGDQIPYDSQYIYDQAALKEQQSAKAKLFHHMMFNVGNKVVDDSINKATVRQVGTNLADPRIQVGDTIWLEVDGYQSTANIYGDKRPPYTNGMYVTNLTRSLDLANGTYTANYSGYRFRGVFGDLWAKNREVYYGF